METLSTSEVIAALAARGVPTTARRIGVAHHNLGIGSGGGAKGANLWFTHDEVDRLEAVFRAVNETVGPRELARRFGVSISTVTNLATRLGVGTQTERGRRFTPAEVERLTAEVRPPGKKGAPIIHGDYVGWRQRYGKGRTASVAEQPGADEGA